VGLSKQWGQQHPLGQHHARMAANRLHPACVLRVRRSLPRARSETYQYYTLPFCLPSKKKYVTEDLGEVLEGDRLVNTPYEIKFKVDVESQVLCTKKLAGSDLHNVRMAIAEDYYFQVCRVV
jgi:hypothetical protein